MPRSAAKPASDQRTATEKRARTRRRVLRAARECVAEKGVSGATAAEIARRCDLSWGVIQYHFGDRFGLLLALLEEGVDVLSAALENVGASRTESIEERVRRLMDDIWSLMSHEDNLVLLEVELQLGRDVAHRQRVRRYVRDTRREMKEVWSSVLPEFAPDRVDAAAHLALSALRGLVLERTLEGGRSSKRTERETVVQAVLGFLGPADD